MRWLLKKLLQWNGVPQEHELIESLPKERLDVFVQEAHVMTQLGYFKWFMEDLELLAERKMFQGDKDMQLFGKGILYCLEMMQSNVKKMAHGNVKLDSPEKKKMRRFL